MNVSICLIFLIVPSKKENNETLIAEKSKNEGYGPPNNPDNTQITTEIQNSELSNVIKISLKVAKGRKKIPDGVKALRGTDQPCRRSETTAMAAVTTIPHSGLKGTAKKVFEVVAAELVNNRLLDLVGVDLVVAYAREMGLYHDTMRELEKEGYTIEVETKMGSTMLVNPKRKVAESALANAKALAAEYGLTPASRSRVAALLSNDPQKDDFADFEEVK